MRVSWGFWGRILFLDSECIPCFHISPVHFRVDHVSTNSFMQKSDLVLWWCSIPLSFAFKHSKIVTISKDGFSGWKYNSDSFAKLSSSKCAQKLAWPKCCQRGISLNLWDPGPSCSVLLDERDWIEGYLQSLLWAFTQICDILWSDKGQRMGRKICVSSAYSPLSVPPPIPLQILLIQRYLAWNELDEVIDRHSKGGHQGQWMDPYCQQFSIPKTCKGAISLRSL